MIRTLCQSCKRAPKRSRFSPPGAPAQSECLLLRFWEPDPDEPDQPRGNAWLGVFSDAESAQMHAQATAATDYQNGDADTCSAHIEVRR